MSDNESYKIDKLLPYKTKPHGRAYVKDGDLQIHLPQTKDASQLQNANAFDKLLSYYHEVGRAQQSTASGIANERESVRLAIVEAETTFKTMMEISNQLKQASQEVLQMQA
jgi:flagellar hook-basal body complex protein FliE